MPTVADSRVRGVSHLSQLVVSTSWRCCSGLCAGFIGKLDQHGLPGRAAQVRIPGLFRIDALVDFRRLAVPELVSQPVVAGLPVDRGRVVPQSRVIQQSFPVFFRLVVGVLAVGRHCEQRPFLLKPGAGLEVIPLGGVSRDQIVDLAHRLVVALR